MKTTSGQSLFELVVAIGVIGLILLTLVSLATLSVRNAAFSRNESEAARVGQETIEWLRGERDRDWDTFITNATIAPVRCFSDLSWSAAAGPCTESSDKISELFLRELQFPASELRDTNGDGAFDSVTAIVVVSWTDAQGAHTIKNSTVFTDWRLK